MWAGFESDTYRLQQQGWSISAEQDIRQCTMRLAFRHTGAAMFGVSDEIGWQYERHLMQYGGDFPLVRVHMMGREIRYHIQGSVDWNFQPIDAMPQFVKTEIKSLEDMVHFAPALARTKQIILPEESVPELMERILKLQQPEREAEFLRQAKDASEGLRTAPPQQKFHAQILSFAA